MRWRVHKSLVKDRLDEFVSITKASGHSVHIVDGHYPDDERLDFDIPGFVFSAIQDVAAGFESYNCWWDSRSYDVSMWASPKLKLIWRDYLLNPHPKYLPYHHLPENSVKPIFVRPDSGRKLFTGFSYGGDIGSLPNCGPYLDPSDEAMWCAVSEHQQLEPIEWRFWVINRRIVTWSAYSWEPIEPSLLKDITAKQQLDSVLVNFARSQALACPLESCTLDIGNTPKGPRVIEINAISCSGFYQCDLEPLIKTITMTISQ